MRNLIFLLALVSGPLLWAQRFDKKISAPLPDSVTVRELAWVDLDNDSLPDVIVIAKNSNGAHFILTYKNSDTTSLVWQSSVSTEFKEASYLIADTDLDNDMDILFSGDVDGAPVTAVYENRGGFQFRFLSLLDKAGAAVKLADLDQDGKRELILSGEDSGHPALRVYRQTTSGWQVVNDSIKWKATAMEVWDFDKDGDNDLFISGKNENNVPVNGVLDNQGGFSFTASLIPSSVEGRVSVADLNDDGFFDILLAGKSIQSKDSLLVLLNRKDHFQVSDSLTGLAGARVFAADFDSNGKTDVHLLGKNDAGRPVSALIYDHRATELLRETEALAFGDYDRDGDLDIVQTISNTASDSILVYVNTTDTVNHVPGRPANPVAAMIFNRLFLHWEEPADDHTVSASLTYDVFLEAQQQPVIGSEFDHQKLKRLTVSHGNNGSKNYALLRSVHANDLSYRIQAVDNSFHAGAGGVCTGGGGGACQFMQVDTVQVCRHERVTLMAGTDALWFSFSEGLLAEGASYSLEVNATDTIFSATPQQGCLLIHAYLVKISPRLVRKTETVVTICEGAEVTLGVEPFWEQVEWASSSKGFISSLDSIRYVPTPGDTVKVTASDSSECRVQRATIFKWSKPVAIVNNEVFQILKGEEVQLEAAGGTVYKWIPPAGLSHDEIPNPVASPSATTEYRVTVKDSLGCEDEAKILVIVENTAFIPTLFTPNSDGRNDDLRIFGLNPAKNFTFSIHNREGSLVYETNDIDEAMTTGWNGTAHGSAQPNGVYYWKVRGETSAGKPVLLNGKRSGSLVLLR